MKKCSLDRDELQKLYIEQKLSANEIGTLKDCDSQTILNYLRIYEIPIRSRGQGMLNFYKKHPEKPWPGYLGGRVEHKGYIYLRQPGHPNAQNGYVAEHRLVVEKRLGRYLLPTEKVHHINGVKDDNRDENLQLISPSDHTIRTMLCNQCSLIQEIRLLKWRVKELEEANQLKLKEEA